jgi:hypothetical protein
VLSSTHCQLDEFPDVWEELECAMVGSLILSAGGSESDKNCYFFWSQKPQQQHVPFYEAKIMNKWLPFGMAAKRCFALDVRMIPQS